MGVTCTEAPRAVSPLPTSYSRTSLEVAVSYQVLTILPSFVEVELALAGPGATSSSLEERNMAAARTYQVLLPVKCGLPQSFGGIVHSLMINANVYPLMM